MSDTYTTRGPAVDADAPTRGPASRPALDADAVRTVREAIEQAFRILVDDDTATVPTRDAADLTYGPYGVWRGAGTLDLSVPAVCQALWSVRSGAYSGSTRKAFTLAAGVRSPRDLDAAMAAARAGRGVR